MRRAVLLVLIVLGGGACDGIPRDAAGSLERARGGVLHVGVTESPPLLTRAGDSAQGPEAELVRSFARGLDARVEWYWAAASENLERLERRELHVVAAGLTAQSPWSSRVAFTRPWRRTAQDDHVLAVPPGESALLAALERHIDSDPATVAPR